MDASDMPGIPFPTDFFDSETRAEDGLSCLKIHIDRLIHAPTASATLLIFSPDGMRGLGIDRADNAIQISLSALPQTKREQTILNFFLQRKVSLVQDYLIDNGDMKVRMLEYEMPIDTQTVIRVCAEALREISEITDGEPLDFSFKEYK